MGMKSSHFARKKQLSMANAEAQYFSPDGGELALLLDIDLTSQRLLDVRAKGSLVVSYQQELQKLQELALGRTIDELYRLKRGDVSSEQKSLGFLPLWLLNRALDHYLGTNAALAESRERLCLCFGVSQSDLKKQILKSADYSLKQLIADTFATSACGSCTPAITRAMENLRLSHGMIEGLGQQRSRFDQKGEWVKVKGLYPGPLLIWLEELKLCWMERENLNETHQIEFTDVEGLHLSVAVSGDPQRGEKILQALGDYLKSETGILFFLHLSS